MRRALVAKRYTPLSQAKSKKAALCVVASVAFAGVVLCMVFVGAMALLLWDEDFGEVFNNLRRELQGGTWF